MISFISLIIKARKYHKISDNPVQYKLVRTRYPLMPIYYIYSISTEVLGLVHALLTSDSRRLMRLKRTLIVPCSIWNLNQTLTKLLLCGYETFCRRLAWYNICGILLLRIPRLYTYVKWQSVRLTSPIGSHKILYCVFHRGLWRQWFFGHKIFNS